MNRKTRKSNPMVLIDLYHFLALSLEDETTPLLRGHDHERSPVFFVRFK
jgi:hypothetical protein